MCIRYFTLLHGSYVNLKTWRAMALEGYKGAKMDRLAPGIVAAAQRRAFESSSNARGRPHIPNRRPGQSRAFEQPFECSSCPRNPNRRSRAVASFRTAVRILATALVSRIATPGQSRAFEQLFE